MMIRSRNESSRSLLHQYARSSPSRDGAWSRDEGRGRNLLARRARPARSTTVRPMTTARIAPGDSRSPRRSFSVRGGGDPERQKVLTAAFGRRVPAASLLRRAREVVAHRDDDDAARRHGEASPIALRVPADGLAGRDVGPLVDDRALHLGAGADDDAGVEDRVLDDGVLLDAAAIGEER